MLISAMRMPGLGLPILSALWLALSGDPSPAQAPGPLVPRSAPGQVREVIAPAATVIASVHYQAQLELTCIMTSCAGNFPKPGANRQLNVTRMSCFLNGSVGSTFARAIIELQRADSSHLVSQYLPVDHSVSSATSGLHTLNRAVDMQVVGAQHIAVTLALASGTATVAACTASGTLDTLQ
jgi:hypothetical protein